MADDIAYLLERAQSLARACDDVKFMRQKGGRVMIRRRLQRARLILTSVVSRLRLGLVLCDRREFVAQLRASLADFHDEVTYISRLLGNLARSDGMLDLVRASGEEMRRHYI